MLTIRGVSDSRCGRTSALDDVTLEIPCAGFGVLGSGFATPGSQGSAA